MPAKPRGPHFPARPPAKARKPVPDRLRMPWQLPGIEEAAAIEDADVFALQALARGEANAAQQLRCIELFRDKLCETDRMSFYPGAHEGDRATIFAEGKRWVGSQVKRMLRMRPAETEKAREFASSSA